MVFDYEWFKNNISKATTAEEDKELELILLEQRIHISYAEDINVYDEKTRETGNFYNQRRRWIASQFYLISKALKKLPK